jgi:hypothetical protein
MKFSARYRFQTGSGEDPTFCLKSTRDRYREELGENIIFSLECKDSGI